MPHFSYDGTSFYYRETGEGVPFFFQHGLTADVNQPFSLLSPLSGIRMLAFDCRAHGLTRPLASDKIGFNYFADDLRALMDHLQIERAIIGGISMGAAIALNFALRYPDRILGLMVSRPAWLEGPLAHNVELYSFVASLLAKHGPIEGQRIFKTSETYERTLRESPAVAATLVNTFELPDIEQRVVILDRIPRDQPYARLTELQSIRMPTLVLANGQDPVHPLDFGRKIAGAIPGAEFAELTAKSVDPERHRDDVQRYITAFLRAHFL